MTRLPNEAHIRRVLEGYSGPWAGEIRQLFTAYEKLSEDHRRLKEACAPLVDCEGDLKAVHIQHAMFAKFVDAVARA